MPGSRLATALLVGVAGALWVLALAGEPVVTGPWGTLAVLVVALAAGRTGRRSELALVVPCVVLLLATADQVAAPGQFSLANDGVFYAVLVAGPALVGALVADRARQLAELHTRAMELERRRPGAVRAARAEEADRVERAVDAALADRLDTVIAGIHAAERDPAELVEVESSARGALAELRDVLGVLGAQPQSLPPAPPATSPTTPPSRRQPGPVDLALVLAGVPLAVETASSAHGSAVANVLVSLLQGALLPTVRRRPMIGPALLMAVAAVQTSLLAPVPPLVSWLVPGLLTAYLVGATPALRSALLGLVVTVLGVLLVTVMSPASARDLDGLAPTLALGLLAWGAGRTVAARERRADELRVLADELAGAEHAEARLAVAEQRAELARELHDVGAHALTVVCLQAAAAQRVADREPLRAREAMTTLVALADDSLAALRHSLGGLAHEAGDAGLDRDALEVLVQLGRALGLEVELSMEGDPRPLPAAVARVAYRVVQESLTNAARHAGCGSVRITVDHRPGSLGVTVVDDGPGPGRLTVPLYGAGIGLAGMRARVEACHGELTHGRDGHGFMVRALLPLAVDP